ncbi:amino acid adenylation domain-containing protein [Azotosporobacter soli]|uniref:amino acid adenylation domain-containing protein n=1 Tax=Azotosporobacter soli TaxID=3055040 RepID=UPI0031FE9808
MKAQSEQLVTLTHAQRRIMYGEEFHPGTNFANLAAAFDLPGDWEIERLKESINAVLDCNDAFRLRLKRDAVSGETLQYVASGSVQSFQVTELATQAQLDDWIHTAVETPFYLYDQKLYRILLARCQGRLVLLLVAHHVICDNGSLYNFIRQVQERYTGQERGSVKRSYLDYINEEKAYLESKQYKTDGDFWRGRFAELPEYSALYGKETPAMNIAAERIEFTLPSEALGRLNAFCTANQLSYFRVFTTLFAVWLARVTGRYDMVLGVPFHNRVSEASKGRLGHFVSTLPLRISLDEEDTFQQALAKVNDELQAAIAHQRYPFDRLVEDLTQRQGERVRLLEYYLVQSSVGRDGLQNCTATLPKRKFSPEPFVFYLNQGLDDAAGLKKIVIEYQSAKYTEQEVQMIYDGLLTLLDGVLTDAAQRISFLPLLSAAQREVLLSTFNDTALEVPLERSYHSLFREQAKRTPENTALVFKETSYTYRQLDERTDSLALLLREHGVTSETIVPIMLERSAEMVIAAIAVMKAGGAYLPLDIKYPQARLDYMLEDSNARLILSELSLKDKFSRFEGFFIDVKDATNYPPVQKPPEEHSSGDNLAAIIYTSGSTGLPKGTMILHRGLINMFYSENRATALSAKDRLASYASFSFDASMWSNFAPLLVGAAVYLVPAEIMLSLDELNRFFETNQISVTFMTTQLCEQFAELVENKSLRLMATGGEKYKAYRETPYQIVNAYGPTEYTIYTTRFLIDRPYANMPIGKPLANTWVYVLDKNLQLQPIGVPGELCIAGAQMARGYRNRPELTAEKFIANPHATNELNQRLYRTGDLVRWLPDGNLEFLSRIDQQVKIRGFRIEIGEIEQKILQYDDVKEAVVIARDDAAGNKYLCGYFAAARKVDVEALKGFMLADLPDFMIPQHLLQIEALPLTANGKVDKKALPEINGGAEIGEYIAPRNDLEQELCTLWQDILGVKQVGISNTFTSLGGTSLKLVVLGAKLQKFFAVSLSVAELLKIPTVEILAKRLAHTPKDAVRYEPIPNLPLADDYAVSPAQKGMYIIDKMADIGNTYHVVLPIFLEGRLDKARLGMAIDSLVERHPALRTSFALRDGEVRQKISAGVRLKKTIKVVDESAIDNAIADFIQRFDLEEAPLFRVALLEIDAYKHMLVLDAHHIVLDGVSVVVLVKELMKLYQNESLPPLTVSYHEYAAWYNARLESGALGKQEAFWLERLQGELPVLNLATDYPRPANKKYQGGKIFADLDKGTAEKLKRIAEAQGVTFFALLLAAFKTLLARYSGQDEIIVGSPFANRTHPDVDGMLGMFVNTLPLRSYPQRDKTFQAYLQEVNEILLSANDNQAYPFEKMVEKLGLERDVSRNPIYDVVFAFFVEEFLFDAGGLSIKRYDYDAKEAHFDLLFYVFENQQGLSMFLEYDRNLYQTESAQRLTEHFINLLGVLADGIDGKLAEFEFISSAERERLLCAFNAKQLPVPFERAYHSLFREQAARTPDKAALVFKGNVLSYRQLDEKTDRLALALRKRGVQRETIVPIMLERSAEMVVAALAVMKAGGAYLPLDIKYPQARLDYMLSDSAATLILSQPLLKEKFIQFSGAFIDVTDPALYEVDGGAELVCPDVNHGRDLAAIIYTSGSTGLPKGTMILHRNIVNMCLSEICDMQMTEADIMASYASFSFDAAMWSNFSPLLTGATVHIVPEEIMLSLADLNLFFEEHRATVTFMTTQLCEQFTELADNKSLRILATGGEKYKSYRPTSYQVVNGYGPTEYTVYTTRFVIDKNYDNIPIGKPLANARVYVVDKDYRLQPVGVPGELCVAGPQLSRGYRNRDDLTLEKFIANPYGEGEIYGRMYRTGDLVRWLPDGNLEFLSRIDQQVKIRGFRIEIGEIEQKIMAYDTVKEAVVVAKDDSSGNKFLCAYFTATEAVALEDLKGFMANDLPNYMIPAYIMQIETMPLNANGKIDKKALPEVERTVTVGEFVAPRSDAEKKVAAVWQEVLGIAQVGVTDNFFSIGGNSIKAISTVAKLQKFFAVSINDLFEQQTLEGLAKRMTPREDNLKVRLSQLKELEKDVERDVLETSEIAAQKRDYAAKNEAYLAMALDGEKDYRDVLVTGATGYLGIHVLHELLTTKTCRLHVIIRGQTQEAAQQRLAKKIAYYFGPQAWQELKIDERVTILAGDLQAAQLGVAAAAYQEMAERVEAIIHTAANVRHYGHYQEFYDSNVQATLELLALAKTGSRKDFHHISTMSVGDGAIAKQERAVFTEYELDIGQEHESYYVRTKLEAEKAVAAARADGINANIFRVGNISHNSESGLYQENVEENAFYTRLKAFINIGAVPEKLDEAEFSFVDSLAKSICLLAYNGALKNETYHLYNPENVKISKLLSEPILNVNVSRLPFGAFIDYLYDNFEKTGFRTHIENILLHSGWLDDDARGRTAWTIWADKTNLLLERLGFVWPKLEADKLKPLIRQALHERIAFLQTTPLFGNLPLDEIGIAAGLARQSVYDSDTAILWEGEANDQLHLVMDGFLEISRSASGGWLGTIGVLGKTEFIGEESIAGAAASSITAEAIIGEALILCFEGEVMRRLFAKDSKLALNLMQGMNEKMRKLEKMLVSIG